MPRFAIFNRSAYNGKLHADDTPQIARWASYVHYHPLLADSGVRIFFDHYGAVASGIGYETPAEEINGMAQKLRSHTKRLRDLPE